MPCAHLAQLGQRHFLLPITLAILVTGLNFACHAASALPMMGQPEYELASLNWGSSIATGSGRFGRPARNAGSGNEEQSAVLEEEVMPLENGAEIIVPLKKRSMSLGRLQFRPGKRRFLPVAGAFAHDPLNRRYELLFMDDHSEGANVPEEGIKGQSKLLSHLRFRLIPGTYDDEDGIPSGVAEVAMGKRSSLASGRIRFRPGKRSMAVGRTGFRPGKRSIATGRVHFRPGKRSLPSEYPTEDEEFFMA